MEYVALVPCEWNVMKICKTQPLLYTLFSSLVVIDCTTSKMTYMLWTLGSSIACLKSATHYTPSNTILYPQYITIAALSGILKYPFSSWHHLYMGGICNKPRVQHMCTVLFILSCRWWQQLTTVQRHNSQIKFLSHSDNNSRLLLLDFAILIINNTFIFMSHIWNNQSPAFAYLLTAGIKSTGCSRQKELQPHVCIICLPCF